MMQTSLRGRWAVRLNWPILDDRMTFYHFQEFYPSLQNTKNYYLTMDNGVRFKLFEGFVSGFQVTTRYNSNPATGHRGYGQLVPPDPWVQLRYDQETVVLAIANAVHPNPREEELC